MPAEHQKSLCIGLDLGGTKLAGALVAADGAIFQSTRAPSRPEDGPDHIVDTIAAVVDELGEKAGGRSVLGIGIGVAGQVDPETGTVRNAPNLHLENFPLKARVEERTRMPVAVLNDVQAVTFGEWTHGAGRGVDDLVCIFVGTGVGGGVVADGHLVRGSSGSAGEVGHMTIDLHGPVCSCGNTGCVEAYAGGWAIAQRARAAVAKDPTGGAALLALVSGKHADIVAATVSRAADDGDPLALAIIQETGEALGAGAASLINGFNPAVIVLGGGVIEGMPRLFGLVQAELRRRALRAALEHSRLVLPALGGQAGTIGAATWILRELGHTGEL
jgi:glucokinase